MAVPGNALHHRQSFGTLQSTALFLFHGTFVMMPGPPFKRWHCYRVRRTFSSGTADTFVIGDILIYVGWDYHSLDQLTCHRFEGKENGLSRQLRVKDGEFFHPQLFFEEVRGVAWSTIAGAHLKALLPKDERAWKKLFDAHWKMIFTAARKSGLDANEAQTIVVEVFKSIPGKMHQFNEVHGSFESWIRDVTRWHIANHHRRGGSST